MKKPAILYHGSPTKNIKEFLPHQKSARDKREGPVVFGSPDKALATCFMTRHIPVECGRFNTIPYFITDRDIFTKHDVGGAIYELPSDSFSTDPEKGMGTMEWISKVPVTPLTKQEYTSSLDAMLEHGVQVYLVDQNTLQRFKDAHDDHGLSVLKTLISENKKLGINDRELP